MKNKSLVWVYPPNNWVSNYKKTFVYGWSNPKAKLYINGKKLKIFPTGNFAQTIKLPKKKNIVQLIQYLNRKKKILIRNVIARRLKEPTRSAHGARRAKQSSNVKCHPEHIRFAQCKLHEGSQNVRRFFASAQNDIHTKGLVIVIDPGHGGKEHGTYSPKGIPESHFNLQIAKLLFKKLKRVYKKIYLTRIKNKFISLKERINFAKKKKCNLLISIHHNALPDNKDPLKHKGIGIYYAHNFVQPFAKKILNSITKESKLEKYGIFKRNFALTKPDFCYAVLIECGFLIHPLEAEAIVKKKTQEKIVSGIVKGLTI